MVTTGATCAVLPSCAPASDSRRALGFYLVPTQIRTLPPGRNRPVDQACAPRLAEAIPAGMRERELRPLPRPPARDWRGGEVVSLQVTPSGARVGLAVARREAFRGHVGVDLRGRGRRVAEDLLDA